MLLDGFTDEHWALLVYLEDCAVNHGGQIDPKKLRGDADQSRITDLQQAGLIESHVTTESRVGVALTEWGWQVASKLRRAYAEGKFAAKFVPPAPPAGEFWSEDRRRLAGIKATLEQAPGVYGNGGNDVTFLLAYIHAYTDENRAATAVVSDKDKDKIRTSIAEIRTGLQDDTYEVQIPLFVARSIYYLIAQIERFL